MSENQKTATKKSKKGKTISLNEYLAEGPKTITVRTSNWSEIVDNEEEENSKPVVINIGVLPTAPRNSTDIDLSNVPNNAPFVAHIANLSFEIDDEGLRRIFADLKPISARILRDGIRSRGIGLVEFEARENLIEALKRTDNEIYGRKIRVTVSDKTNMHQTDGGRGTFGNNRPNRGGGGGGEERPEMGERWKRAEPRSDDLHDDRSSSGFNRERTNRNDHGRSNMDRGSRDNQGNDYGFGYPRQRDERGGGHSGGNRDYNRQGQRNRNNDDDNRSNSGVDRPRYAGRYSDTRDTRDRDRDRERNRTNDETHDDQREPPRERQRLQLQPRTKPLEEFGPLSGSSSSVNNVAANAGQSSISNADDSSSSVANTSSQQTHDSSINEQRDSNQQESQNSNDQVNTSDEQSTVKPSRGAGASIFGGAKPVDTTAREREIEKKLNEVQLASSETTGDNEKKTSSSRPSNYRNERDNYRSKRSSQNDDHRDRDRDRDRRDDGRSGHGSDYHHKREYSGGRQYEDEGTRRQDDDHPPRRRGGYDRTPHGSGPNRRDHDSVRSNKFNNSERNFERGNNRQREDRNQDSDDFLTYGRSSNNHNSNSNSRNQQRGGPRRNVQVEEETNKLQLSNKFGMLDDDDLDDDENEEAQSPSIDE